MPGNPDFQKVTQWQGDNLLPAYNQNFNVGNNVGAVYQSAQWSAFIVSVTPSAGFGKVTVNWWNNATKTILIRADTWPVNTSTGLAVVIPAFGPFVSLDVNVTSAGAMTAATILRGVNNAGMSLAYPVTQGFISSTSLNVAAGATTTVLLPWIRKGPAYAQFVPGDTSAKLRMIVAQFNEGTSLQAFIWDAQFPTAPVSQSLILPDTITGVRFVNTDGVAAHSVQYQLIPS